MFRLLFGVTLTASLASAAVLIDNFTTTQVLSVTGPGANPITSSSGVVTGLTSIGGNRYASITRTSGAGTGTLGINSPSPSLFNHSNDVAATSESFVLWDGGIDGSINPVGLAADLTEAGSNNLLRFVSNVDLNGVSVTFRVYTGSVGQFSEFVQPLTGGGSDFTYLLPFASFVPTGGGADFTNVGAITMSTAGPARMDLQIDLLEATTVIPEPATLSLFGVALLGLGLLRRKVVR